MLKTSLAKPDGEGQIRQMVPEEVSARMQKETKARLPKEARSRNGATAALDESQAVLLRSREELRALTAELFQTHDEERHRVSKEVHDNLTQKIAKLAFDLETLEQQLPADLNAVKQRLQAAREQLTALCDDLCRVAEDLHPSKLENLGLSVALRYLIREFSGREDLQLYFTSRNVPKGIPPEIARPLFRIVQGALRNVVKKEERANLRITLAGKPNELCLTIRYNGAELFPQSVREPGALGLIAVQERVRVIHGDLCIERRRPDRIVIRIRVSLTL